MGPFEHIIHTFNFIAPAWGVALFGVLIARLSARWWLPLASWSLLKQTVVSGFLGMAVLAGGLVLWGVDGKMATYSALVIVCGTAQWLMCKGWQR
jgi:small basic protein